MIYMFYIQYQEGFRSVFTNLKINVILFIIFKKENCYIVYFYLYCQMG